MSSLSASSRSPMTSSAIAAPLPAGVEAHRLDGAEDHAPQVMGASTS